VVSNANKALRARQQARTDRLAKAVAKRDGTPWPPPAPASRPAPKRRRPTSLECPWCGTPIPVKPAGRIPTWCSPTCRHRAWEQNRAAASGRSAIQLVERIVEVDRPVPTAKKDQTETLPNSTGWDIALAELVRQLGSGRIYQRDLPAITRASLELNDALHRRLTKRR
jgi:endogenous inhibitor of DNA gyrase (YacG/DUF329 family)